MTLFENKLCTVCEVESLIEYDQDICPVCKTKKIITKVICIKCNNPMTTVSIQKDNVLVIKAYCYPCENDAWQDGCNLVSKQMARSLK